ncbi:UNVERIFIED_CONTAM: hypothetical protein Sradi_6989700 [Sesamum radiatum]|uniref:Uncharacterized protein n=1 Tax=Sesamum radiatum TaxID=300843 RepID=A0AAW2JCU1_SESRA
MSVEAEEQITFSSKDLNDKGGLQDDLMVIKLDIIFWNVLKQMGLKDSSLSPVQTRLVGFGGSEVASMGTIVLPVLMGEEPKRRTTIVRAVVSTYHQKVKFPTKNGIGEVSCDQRKARRCYNMSLRKGERDEQTKRKDKEEVKEREDLKKFKSERMEPAEDYKSIELIVGEPDKITRTGSNMSKLVEILMIEFLRRSIDMFAWSPSDFKGIDPEVIVHRFNVNPMV